MDFQIAYENKDKIEGGINNGLVDQTEPIMKQVMIILIIISLLLDIFVWKYR